MRIGICGGLALLAACGPKGGGKPAKDFTLHDKLVVLTRPSADAMTTYSMLDPETGALTTVYTQQGVEDSLWDAVWAGRCVVMATGEGIVRVVDPVTDKTWMLDEGNGGVTLAVSADGLRVAWDCTGETGPSICVSLVDATDEIREVATTSGDASFYPFGWRGDEILYSDGVELFAVNHKGGAPVSIMTVPSNSFQVAPGGAAIAYPDGDHFVVRSLQGDPAGYIVPLSGEAAPEDCDFAGPSHLVCWRGPADERSLELFDWATGSSKTLATPGLGVHVLGAPTGDGAAYTAGFEGAAKLYVVRGGAPPRELPVPPSSVRDLMDWRP